MNAVERLTLEMIGEDPDNPDVFTDDSTGLAQIRDSINDAIQEIALLTGSYKEFYYIPIRAGRVFYRLDFIKGYIAWINDVRLQSRNWRLEQTSFIKLNRFNPRWLRNNGEPRAYFPIGLNYVGFWPVPSSDSDVAELHCTIIPQAYSEDTDRLLVRKNLEYAAVHYAVGEYYASRGDAKTAIRHHNDYLKILNLDQPFMRAAEYISQYQTRKEPWPTTTA
jgi:hypothetical protein